MPRGKKLRAIQREAQRQQEVRRGRQGWTIRDGKVIFARQPGWLGQLEVIRSALEATK